MTTAKLKSVIRVTCCASMVALILPGLAIGAKAQPVTVRASVATGGVQGNGDSPGANGARISADGRFVAFRSLATNLVAGGDTNGFSDIFRRDLQSGQTIRVSVVNVLLGTETDGNSNNPSISADGNLVAFTSHAANLVPGDGNVASDVFVRNIAAGTTTRVSVANDGAEGDSGSDSSAISALGNIIAFRSDATNLVPEGDTNVASDVFVRNILGTPTTTRASVATGGAQGNGGSGSNQVAVSANGNVVGFTSVASNLILNDTNGVSSDVFVRNLGTSTTTLISQTTLGLQGFNSSWSCALSSDGMIVAFVSNNGMVNGDTNNAADVFVRDIITGTTTRISVASGANGTAGNLGSGVSPDGTGGIDISSDGRYVVFRSKATNLIKVDKNNFEDVFLRDRQANKTTLVSVAFGVTTPANGLSVGPSMSADGRYVMFCSYASNLLAAGVDNNGWQDVFVRGPLF